MIEQSPRAATRAAAGSVIVLTVASAARAMVEVFEMPNVVGRADADATRSLAEFKVSRSDVDSAEPRGRIVAQTPAAGTTLLPGSPVSLQMSSGPAGAATSTPNQQTAATPSAPSKAEAKTESGRGVLRGVFAIGAAIVLGLIFGALLMRQWLLRQRAVTAADNAITSMSPTLPVITTVDILLEEEPAEAAAASEPDHLVQDFEADAPSSEPHEKDLGTSDEQEKHSGS